MGQEDGIAFCERLFAKYLDGNPLMNNATHVRGSAIWIRFPRVVCGRWVHHETIEGKRVPIVLMGDAAHTAHFSIGSGTKLRWKTRLSWHAALPPTRKPMRRCRRTKPCASSRR